MITRRIDLNCSNSRYFMFEYDDDNTYGVTTDQEMFARWLRDLRSRNYQQLQGTLYSLEDKVSYCAIGLLIKKKLLRTRDDVEDMLELEHLPLKDYFTEVNVISDIGFKYSLLHFIIELNDSCKLTFDAIADIVEIIHKEIRGEDNKQNLSTLSQRNSWGLSSI